MLTAIVSATVTACQTSSQIGKGPITLSPGVRATYEKYLEGNGLSFAVTEDGRGSMYYFCQDSHCRSGSPFEAVRTCNHYYGEGRCKLYAIGKEIVWQFDEPASPDIAYRPNRQADIRHQFLLEWDGHFDSKTVSVAFTHTMAGRFTFYDQVTGICQGAFRILQDSAQLSPDKETAGYDGEWTVECAEGQEAEGTARLSISKSGTVTDISGQGKDDDDQSLTFTRKKG